MKHSLVSFSIDAHQYLDESGQLTDDAPQWSREKETLLSRYTQLQRLRTFDQKAINLQRTGKMGTYAAMQGQEAINVGLANALAPDDVYVSCYRDYGILTHRGATFDEILQYWGGNEQGNCYANNPSDFPPCVPIATQCLHAAGIASAFKLRREPHAVLVTVGDGGTSEGDFYEAINVAGVWELPLVVVVVNNQWAISVPSHRQSAVTCFAQKGIAAGIPVLQVDGNDCIAVETLTSEALSRARAAGGATLIEAKTYRLSDHTTADDATRYRASEEVQQAHQRDPLERMRLHLMQVHGITTSQLEDIQKASQVEIQAAIAHYQQASSPHVDEMFQHLFENPPSHLAEQRILAQLFGESHA